MEKFLRLYLLMQPDERKSFLPFLAMPWSYPGKPLKPVQEPVVSFLSRLPLEELDSQNLKKLAKTWERKFWKEKYPGKAFSIHQLTDLFSPCTRRLEIFFVLRQYNDSIHPLSFEANLKREVESRSKNPRLASPGRIRFTPLSSYHGFLTESILQGLVDEAVMMHVAGGNDISVTALERIIHCSEHLSALKSARFRTLLLLQKQQHDPSFVIPQQLAKENHLLRAYQLLAQLMLDKKGETAWLQLVEILMDKHFPAKESQCKELFTLSLAAGMKLFQSRNRFYVDGVNQLFRKGIAARIVLSRNQLKQSHFISAIKLSLLAGEGEEALRRLETYVPLLSVEDQKLGIAGYCRSLCLLELGRNSEARRELETFKPRGIGKIQFYVQMAKIQFELSPEGVTDLLDNYKRALLRIRNEKHAARVREESQYISLMRRLAEASHLSETRAAALRKDISQFPFGQEWLMKKFEQQRSGKKNTQKRRPR